MRDIGTHMNPVQLSWIPMSHKWCCWSCYSETLNGIWNSVIKTRLL